MATCDYCAKTALVVVVTPRPSDPSEIVSILELCGEHDSEMTITQVEEVLATGGHAVARPEVLWQYIESDVAMSNGHIFLTI